jgi:hypothetical protein
MGRTYRILTGNINMKRKLYRITSSVGHNTTKNAWNSSIREIEKLVREMATAENSSYELTGSHSEKEGLSPMGEGGW